MSHHEHVERAKDIRVESQLAWLVATGVAGAGIYDFSKNEAPAGLFKIGPDISLTLFLIGCFGAAVIATFRDHSSGSRVRLRSTVVALSALAVAHSDPTYASLIVIIPLIDIRRRGSEPTRSLWTVGILAMVAGVVMTERTTRSTTEIEAMLGLAIALLVVALLGDALRMLDRRIKTEAQFAQLTERNRLAEDIHDSLGHHLLAASVQLQKAQALRTSDTERAASAVVHAFEAVSEAISETRLIVDSGRDHSEVATGSPLHTLAQRIVPTTTAMQLDIDGDLNELDALRRVAIYRIVQEALTNLVKHANADAATISSYVDDVAITVAVTDNGTGFTMEELTRPGGLSNMRRRVEELGGRFNIESGDYGTKVTATVPR